MRTPTIKKNLKNSAWSIAVIIFITFISMGLDVIKVNPAGMTAYVSMAITVAMLCAGMFYIAQKYNGNKFFVMVFSVCLICSIAFRAMFFNEKTTISPINTKDGFKTLIFSMIQYAKGTVSNSPILNILTLLLFSIILSVMIEYVVSMEGKIPSNLITFIEGKIKKPIDPSAIGFSVLIVANFVIAVLGRITGSLIFNELLRLLFIYGTTCILKLESDGTSEKKVYLANLALMLSTLISFMLLHEAGFLICSILSGSVMLFIYAKRRKALYLHFVCITVASLVFIVALFSIPFDKINIDERSISVSDYEIADSNSLISKAMSRTSLFKNRLYSWLSSTDNETGKQVIIGQQAVALGGIFGCDKNLSFTIPFEKNDMILQYVCLHLGSFVVVLIITILAFFFISAFSISTHIKLNFKSMFMAGLTTSCALQIIVQSFCSIGVIPFTGIGIPFISSGDSSFVMTLATSILLSISSTNIKMKERLK